MRKEVVIHIGTHKTGTTSIQTFLDRNEDMMREQGLYYPRIGRMLPSGKVTKKHDLLAFFFYKNYTVHKDIWEQLCAEIDATELKTVLLSTEHFCLLDTQAIHQIRRALKHYPIRIILYIRNPFDYLVSAYHQDVKRGKYPKKFQQYLQERLERCNYPKLVDTWGEHFGTKNIQIRLFDQVKMDTGILTDFLTTLGLNPKHFSSHLNAVQTVNVSPIPTTIHALQRLNILEKVLGNPLNLFSNLRHQLLNKTILGTLFSFLLNPFQQKPTYFKKENTLEMEQLEHWSQQLLNQYIKDKSPLLSKNRFLQT